MAYRLLPLCLLLLSLSLAACSSFRQTNEENQELAESITDTQTLVDYLVEQNVNLQDNGPFQDPGLTTPGHAFTVTSGGDLFVFEYPNGGDALVDIAAREVQREVRQERQVYRKEGLVVVYYGDDPRVERALTRVMSSRSS